jgi:hypothetical protein
VCPLHTDRGLFEPILIETGEQANGLGSPSPPRTGRGGCAPRSPHPPAATIIRGLNDGVNRSTLPGYQATNTNRVTQLVLDQVGDPTAEPHEDRTQAPALPALARRWASKLESSTVASCSRAPPRSDTPFPAGGEHHRRIAEHPARVMTTTPLLEESHPQRQSSPNSYGPSSDSDTPAETETVLRIWRAEGRVREEHEGGPRDGAYAVRDGDLWWSWDARTGAMSNQDDPKVGFSVGDEVSFMLDPTPLLGSLRFTASPATLPVTQAGAPVPRSSARPRWRWRRHRTLRTS